MWFHERRTEDLCSRIMDHAIDVFDRVGSGCCYCDGRYCDPEKPLPKKGRADENKEKKKEKEEKKMKEFNRFEARVHPSGILYEQPHPSDGVAFDESRQIIRAV